MTTTESILLVDDDASSVEALSTVLLREGYRVQAARTGSEALAQVNAGHGDLILLSTQLIDVDGFALASQIQDRVRQTRSWPVPLLFMGSPEPEADRLKAFEAGGVDYLTKPIFLPEAVARVNTHLTSERLTRELSEARGELERHVEERSAELNRQVQLFRKFVPETFALALDNAAFDVRQGLSREEFYSVLCCDIRSFTTFSESITCTECFRFLNSYFTVMEPGIRNYGGFVYQYVGDSIMALFPPGNNDAVDNVLESAVALQTDILGRYNAGRAKAGYQPIRIGAGIHTGSVAIGIAGTPERMDASAFGSTVNIAARCETLTKELGSSIVFTHETFTRLSAPARFDIQPLGPHPIRGMSHEVHLYAARVGTPT